MGDMIGGEAPLPASRLRSRFLRAHGRAVAAHCVRRCYDTWPELDRKFGKRGRQHAARDAGWHLEHLDEAVAVGEPRIFADYADWLAGLLKAWGIGQEQVAAAFGFLAEGLEAVECPAGQAADRGVLVALLRDNQSRLMGPVPDRAPQRASGALSVRPEGTAPALDSSGTPVHRAYFDCLMGLDREGAYAVAESYLAEHGDVLDLYVDVLGPAMVHTGLEWEVGRISIAHEHYISEVTRDVIGQLGPRGRPEAAAGAPVAVACCAPRERHGIGLMMVADALRAGGLEVHIPGEAQSAEAVADLVAGVRAHLLCLSCTMGAHLGDAAGMIALERRSRPGLAIAVGGSALRGLGEGAAGRLGADWTLGDAREILRSLPAWKLEMRSSRPGS